MKRRKIPMRKCVACQEMKPKKELMRVVRTPQGDIQTDPTGKVSGRGAYICPTEDCFTLAKKNKGLDRALKTKVEDQVYEQLAQNVSK